MNLDPATALLTPLRRTGSLLCYSSSAHCISHVAGELSSSPLQAFSAIFAPFPETAGKYPHCWETSLEDPLRCALIIDVDAPQVPPALSQCVYKVSHLWSQAKHTAPHCICCSLTYLSLLTRKAQMRGFMRTYHVLPLPVTQL